MVEDEKVDFPMSQTLDEDEISGALFKLLRESRGLSIEDLAKKSGIEKEVLEQIETGQQPALTTKVKIQDGLNRHFALDTSTVHEIPDTQNVPSELEGKIQILTEMTDMIGSTCEVVSREFVILAETSDKLFERIDTFNAKLDKIEMINQETESFELEALWRTASNTWNKTIEVAERISRKMETYEAQLSNNNGGIAK